MNYGDKHTEDSLSLRLGRLYGIERGLDCGPNIIMSQYKADGEWVIPKIMHDGREVYCSFEYEADFLYITN